MLKTNDKNLVFREARLDDLQKISEFQEICHGEGEYVHDIFSGKSPEMEYSDYVLLTDSVTDEIIACAMMIPEYVYIEGVKFKCRRFELTGTHNAYRNQGYMRKLFELGENHFYNKGGEITSVEGKPWFYSQFEGYALSRGAESIMLSSGSVNHYALKESRYHVNDCNEEDFIKSCKQYKQDTFIKKCGRIHYKDDELIKYDFFPNGIKVIADKDNNYIGSFLFSSSIEDGYISVWRVILNENVCLIDVRNIILKFFMNIIKPYEQENPLQFKGIKFELGSLHPLYDVLRSNNTCDNILTNPIITAVNKGFPGYYKILNIEKFLQKLIPVFEKRIADSSIKYYTGEFILGLYRAHDALNFTFEDGRIISIELMKQEYGNVNMPIEMLTQCIMGYIKVDELYPMFFSEIFIKEYDSLLILKALFD